MAWRTYTQIGKSRRNGQISRYLWPAKTEPRGY
jgi:hypothetical protein